MRTPSIIIAVLALPAIAGADAFPANWQAFKDSPLAEDKALVSSIERTGKNPYDLCMEWGRGERAKKETRRNRAIFEYLLKNNHIETQDMANVKNRDIAIGMSACGVMASLGRPTRGHTRESAYGMSTQMVYERDGRYNTYIHLEAKNGNIIVTSISR